jgi:thioredoxin reductase
MGTHRTRRRDDEWVIVGAGLQGLYFARELLDSGVPHDAITILDKQGGLLQSFRRYARACGMTLLRSPHVQHLESDPFALQRYARAHHREDELVTLGDKSRRPTLSLFLDHCESVIDRFALDMLVRKATVTGIEPTRDGLVVRTDGQGPYRAANVLVAIGYGGRYNYPKGSRETNHLTHVWEHDRPPAAVVEEGADCWVVGGGVTAGQVALSVAETANSVTLCTPHKLRTALTIADPAWLNWEHIERTLHTLPPGSAERYEQVCDVRNDGTMPEYIKDELEADSTITVKQGRIAEVTETSTGLEIRGKSGEQAHPDRAILATGFADPSEHPFVRRLAKTLGLARGECGLPVLDDETLAWRRTDGYLSSVYVSGTLSTTTVGPFAGTIPGSRRAAERILGRAAIFA